MDNDNVNPGSMNVAPWGTGGEMHDQTGLRNPVSLEPVSLTNLFHLAPAFANGTEVPLKDLWGSAVAGFNFPGFTPSALDVFHGPRDPSMKPNP